MQRQVYFEHDNRGASTSTYKPPTGMGGRRRKYKDYPRGFHSGKSRLVDDADVDMGGTHNSGGERSRYNPYKPQQNNNRKNHYKKRNKSKHTHGPIFESQGDWFQITIPFGRKAGKPFILKSISSFLQSPFIPYNFRFVGNSAEFYVNDRSMADDIKDLSRRITTPDGFKLMIQTQRGNLPPPSFNAETMEMLKNLMSARYDVASHSLNLSKFHTDDGMKSVGLFLPLNRPTVLTVVSKIIKEHIPELEVLNISDNKLHTLDPLGMLVPVCKQLKSVILQNNKLRSIVELNHLKGLDILDLVIDGNPLCDDYKDKTTYISAVRDRFPKLINLDGQSLPAPIGFDLGPETFPASRKCFFAAKDVKELVVNFLDAYYKIYDSGDRTDLLAAYHEQANFSLCLSKHVYKASHGAFAAYNMDNRNLLKITDFSQGFRLLKQGKLSIVNALTELPQTMHDPNSFSVDIYHISSVLMSFSVIGVFKEVGADINNAMLKTFSRTFVVVAQPPGFVITNETLFIEKANQEQQSKAFKVPAPTPSPSPAPAVDEKSPQEKQMLVHELAKQTGMNFDFSTKCLEESEWDYQRSVALFVQCQKEGNLPPEAFVVM